MSDGFVPFSGKGCKLRSPSDVESPQEEASVVDLTSDGNGVDAEMRDSAGDQAAAEQASEQFALAVFQSAISEQLGVVEHFIFVAESWNLELPTNKYGQAIRVQVTEFIEEAKDFKEKTYALEESGEFGMMAAFKDDIVDNIRQHAITLGNRYKVIQGDVDMVMGRASTELRKLKREGSDVSDVSSAVAKRSRSSRPASGSQEL
jgi:hypothetical protein